MPIAFPQVDRILPFVIASALLLGLVLVAPQRSFDFYAEGPYVAGVPKPETILRYAPGQKVTTFRDQEEVLLAIAEKAKDRVRFWEYGRSTQGRPLRLFAISSAKNISRLEAIRADLNALANPTPGKDMSAVAARVPATVWINQCIHGDETASFESAMWLLYNLAASQGRRITDFLDDTLVLLNPVYNPDGHERFAVWTNTFQVGNLDRLSFEQDGRTRGEANIMQGRVNQYRFDMNRDRVAMSQAESIQEVKEFLRWNPHVYVDQHGQTENFFMPPNPMAINANVDRERLNKWTDVFGRAIGNRFDRQGWTYYVKDIFDCYYPGYLDSWTTLSGAIGMTHETDGGYFLRSERSDGSVLTLRDGMEKHFAAALAVIESSAKNRRELVASTLKFKERAVSGEHAGKFQRVVVVSNDPRPLVRLQDQLDRHGIRAGFATKAFTQKDANDYWSTAKGEQTFPAGSLVIDMAQSQGPLAKALLEIASDFEPEFIKAQEGKKATAPEGEDYPGPEGSEFYDFTGWSLIYAHNLKAWWCESAPAVETQAKATVETPSVKDSPVGYAVDYRDLNDILFALDSTIAGVRGMALRREVSVGGVKYGPGTVYFLAARNEPGYEKTLITLAKKRNVTLRPLPTSYPDERWGPGSENVITLRKPKIGMLFGSPASTTAYGHPWFLMDKVFGLPFTPLSANALNGDLSDYTAIILPAGANPVLTGKFGEWIRAGGCVISLESMSWALGRDRVLELATVAGERQSLPGSLFRAQIDARSFLSFGYGGGEKGWVDVAVPVQGSTFFTVRKEGGSAVRFANDETPKLLTGWAWKDETEKALRNTVWAQENPFGRGHVVLFTQDPSERAMWPGLWKMLLNAMLFGPSV